MEHIELAGVHSGDSAAPLPPLSCQMRLSPKSNGRPRCLGLALGVKGPLNIQFAVRDEGSLFLEVQPQGIQDCSFCEQGHRHSPGTDTDQDHAWRKLSEFDLNPRQTSELQ